jgi:hypothetical protein
VPRPARGVASTLDSLVNPAGVNPLARSHAPPDRNCIHGHFHPWRHLMTAAQYRRTRAKAFRIWQPETGVQIRA